MGMLLFYFMYIFMIVLVYSPSEVKDKFPFVDNKGTKLNLQDLTHWI